MRAWTMRRRSRQSTKLRRGQGEGHRYHAITILSLHCHHITSALFLHCYYRSHNRGLLVSAMKPSSACGADDACPFIHIHTHTHTQIHTHTHRCGTMGHADAACPFYKRKGQVCVKNSYKTEIIRLEVLFVIMKSSNFCLLLHSGGSRAHR
jgi:hypothetical protein